MGEVRELREGGLGAFGNFVLLVDLVDRLGDHALHAAGAEGVLLQVGAFDGVALRALVAALGVRVVALAGSDVAFVEVFVVALVEEVLLDQSLELRFDLEEHGVARAGLRELL